MVRTLSLEEKKEIRRLQKLITPKMRPHKDFEEEVIEEIKAIEKYGLWRKWTRKDKSYS